MSDTNPSSPARFFVVAVLMLLTLGFGLAGLCGATYTAIGLTEMLSGDHNPYAGGALIIAVPSLLIGGGLAWICSRGVRRLIRRGDAPPSA